MRKVLCLVTLLALAAGALASPFERPPEVYAPEWETPFPYQRNIDWTFDTNPRGGPSANGAPGAHYEGYHDRFLWDSDYVQFEGQVGWYDRFNITDTVGWDGMVGIDNRPGNEPVSGMALFHIDNWARNELKNIWVELDFILSDQALMDAITMGIVPESGTSVVGDWQGDPRQLPNGLFRLNAWVQIAPNPLYEDFVLMIEDVPPGNFALLDRLHIATECLPEQVIPEPATLCLLGVGLVAGALRRRR